VRRDAKIISKRLKADVISSTHDRRITLAGRRTLRCPAIRANVSSTRAALSPNIIAVLSVVSRPHSEPKIDRFAALASHDPSP
jgi:hypothetical protein